MDYLNNLFQNNYGQKIRQFRKKRELSQFDLEIAANLSLGTVSRIEKGRINPTKETLYKIAVVLELEMYEVIELFNINQFNTIKSFLP